MSILESIRVGIQINNRVSEHKRDPLENISCSDYERRFGFLEVKNNETGVYVKLLATAALQAEIVAFKREYKREPTAEELIQLSKKNPRNSLTGDFSTNEFAGYNDLAYSYPELFKTPYKPAPYFSQNAEINRTLGLIFGISANNAGVRKVRVKELAAGSDPGRWNHMIKDIYGFDILADLSDFVPRKDYIMTPQIPNLTLRRSVEDMTKKPKHLHEKDRYHAIFCTYAFDTVRTNADSFIENDQGKWFQYWYRLSHVDAPNMEQKIHRLKNRKVDTLYELFDFGLEIIRLPIDVEMHPYGDIIKWYSKHYKHNKIHTAFGEADIIADYIDHQLHKKGTFFTGDVGVESGNPAGEDHYFVSNLGRFVSVDAKLAYQILLRKGYNAQVYNGYELTQRLRVGFAGQTREEVDYKYPKYSFPNTEYLVVNNDF